MWEIKEYSSTWYTNNTFIQQGRGNSKLELTRRQAERKTQEMTRLKHTFIQHIKGNSVKHIIFREN